uniref:DNA/RNA-binding protein Alba-like domain-containing protein n=1 Tax=Oxyrrhis marina TaxID=2969 RepID=A0A7S3ULK6_OXYMA|mmetsp:Transcript_1867/g.2799  ORF Transcript_1867/g.2799 Transcript_1867/m.2799 type:complete len:100 (-) Transcript_1867:70-369(-)
MTEATHIKVTAKRSVGFYIRAAKSFLEGTTDKDGNEKAAVKNITISGLGNAINAAVAAAAAVEREGIGNITRVETQYPDIESGSVARGVAQIVIDVEKK